jgi:hypothetical protein
MCSSPANKVDGTPCDDGSACTQSDTCQAGICAGGNAVVCTALDTCHVPGQCDPVTGVCTNLEKPDAAACDDGDACTQADTCLSGVCVGGNPVVCHALDTCHAVGVCDGATGNCPNPSKPDGAACADGACNTGVCVSAPDDSSGTPGESGESGGCGCKVGLGAGPASGALWVSLGLLLLRRRGRHR